MSGYTNCACRDCMDVTVSSNPARPELCEPCHAAGCGDPDATTWPECQRDDAYGDEYGSPSANGSCGCGATGVHGVDHDD